LKTLLLIRHAKSDWNDSSLSDFDRPLNERGKADAPRMAKRLLERKIPVDAFISSPAKRAKKTATIFAEAFGNDKKDLILEPSLYDAGVGEYPRLIGALDDSLDTVAIFSHNYALTDFANQLTNTRVDNIPTSGIYAVKAKCKSWKQFAETEKEFLFFDFPKNAE
jgi:phosphohistidine phosphatase